MNWQHYIIDRARERTSRPVFRPETQEEARQALALGIIDIGDYVEFSLSVEPVLDTVHDRDPEVRKNAIQKLAHRKDPLSIKLLRDLLLDEEEEVRLYAASELDRLEREYHTRIHQLRQTVTSNPADAAARFGLAAVYLDYAGVLLSGSPLADFFVRKAIDLLDALVKEHPQNADYLLLRARGHQLRGDHARALIDFRGCLKIQPGNINAFLGLAESLFYQKRFNDVRQVFRRIPSINREGEAFDAYLFWTEAGA